MRRIVPALAALLLLSGCAARPRPAEPASTLLRLDLAPASLTLCEGMTRHIGVGAAWTGSSRPEVSGLPEIRWMSPDLEVVRVDSLTGGITAVGPGKVVVVVHGRLGNEYGRATLPVTVLPGRWDDAAWRESGELVCRPE